jgi:alpha-L-rhamnosidase
MDNWSAAASRIPRQLVAELDFPRPMEEIAFEQLIPGLQNSEGLAPLEDQQLLRDMGMWTQMIPLTQLIVQIDELHEMTVRNNKPQLEIYNTVQRIASALDSWILRLPEQLQYTSENLERYSKLGHGRTLIALHLGFHHHGQLLYYQFLHYNREAPTTPQLALAYTYANRCKEHAAGITNLLWDANSTPGHECLWVVNGHLLAISSSIHLHTLLFGNGSAEIDAAKSMLKRNFEMMMSMRRYWPSLDLSMSRLRSFHRECQNSMDTSFAMDQWMLNFLQRYTKPVTDEKIALPRLPGEAGSPDMPEWQAEIFHTDVNNGL